MAGDLLAIKCLGWKEYWRLSTCDRDSIWWALKSESSSTEERGGGRALEMKTNSPELISHIIIRETVLTILDLWC